MVYVPNASAVAARFGRAFPYACILSVTLAGAPFVSAQELPANVASGLVDRALSRKIEVREPAPSSTGMLPNAMILAAALTLVIVVTRLKGSGLPRRATPGTESKSDQSPLPAQPARADVAASPTFRIPHHLLESVARAQRLLPEEVLEVAPPKIEPEAPDPDSVRSGGIDIVLPRF